ncbi:MAG: hypothetical protein LBU32_24365 [Clostridiales bacterium]|jgi:hypothetical protein|nr:hypothetical protein [Clostridiales bacterium]
MIVPNYKLPASTPLMALFPVECQELPPNGFYIQSNAAAPANHEHVYTRACSGGFGSNEEDQDALDSNGFVRCCAHAANGAWQPAKLKGISDWRAGDGLFTFFSLISEAVNRNV